MVSSLIATPISQSAAPAVVLGGSIRLPLSRSISPLWKPSSCSFPMFFPKPSILKISASISPAAAIIHTGSPKSSASPENLLTGSTRTVTTLFAVSIIASKILANGIFNLAVQLREPLVSATGPSFFAAIKRAPVRSVSTPLTVVAAGMAKWLDIYSGVLMVRVLLSWFPNIPWDRQPLSAIRDLCDPYLNLFRNVIPPIFDTLDISPLFAFAVLGTLGSILNNTRAM